MAAYTFHVSFDWAATPNGDKSPLELGIVIPPPPTEPPIRDDHGNMTYSFTDKDTICFEGFNKTSGAKVDDYLTQQGKNPSISFRKASDAPAEQTTSSPLADEMRFSQGPADALGSSEVLEPNKIVPMWKHLGAAQAVSAPGRYHFTVSLYVVGPEGGDSRLFEHDPEMIVQATPPTPPPEGQVLPPESSAARR